MTTRLQRAGRCDVLRARKRACMKMCQLSIRLPSRLHKSQIAASFLAGKKLGIHPSPGQTHKSSSSLVQPQSSHQSNPRRPCRHANGKPTPDVVNSDEGSSLPHKRKSSKARRMFGRDMHPDWDLFMQILVDLTHCHLPVWAWKTTHQPPLLGHHEFRAKSVSWTHGTTTRTSERR